MKPIKQRFWSRVQKSRDGCWNWTASLNSQGYGVIRYKKRSFYAHRISYVLHSGVAIPDGMFVCHRCDNPKCVNPNHLFLGTQRDNLNDAVRKGRTARGEKCGRAILTKRMVQDIRRISASYRQCEIARLFEISQGTVSQILTGKTWIGVGDRG